MADMIGSGSDPDRPLRRVLGAAVTGALLAAAVVAVVVQDGTGKAREAAPTRRTPTPPSTSIVYAPSAPTQATLVPPPSALACAPCSGVLDAPHRADPLTADLFVGGGRLGSGGTATASGAAGDARLPIHRGEQVTDIAPLGAGVAVIIAPAPPAYGTAPVYALGATGPPRLLGRANYLLPGADGSCWLETGPGRYPGPSNLVQVDRTGRVGTRMSVPPDAVGVAGTPYGLLVEAPGIHAGLPDEINAAQIELIGPDGREQVLDPHGSAVVAVRGNTVAWSRTDGSVVIEDLSDRASASYDRRGDTRADLPPDTGALSLDGRSLALSIPGTTDTLPDAASYGYVEVLDLATGKIRQVDGVRTQAYRPPALGWLDGHTLALELSFDVGLRIATWDSHTGRTAAVPGALRDPPPPALRVVTLPAG